MCTYWLWAHQAQHRVSTRPCPPPPQVGPVALKSQHRGCCYTLSPPSGKKGTQPSQNTCLLLSAQRGLHSSTVGPHMHTQGRGQPCHPVPPTQPQGDPPARSPRRHGRSRQVRAPHTAPHTVRPGPPGPVLSELLARKRPRTATPGQCRALPLACLCVCGRGSKASVGNVCPQPCMASAGGWTGPSHGPTLPEQKGR